jgi:hypothetical protein
MQLGVRQARYIGRTKTLFQVLMAATVANLTLVATRVGLMRDRNHPQTIISIHVHASFVVRRVFAILSPRSEPGFSATHLGGMLSSQPPRSGILRTSPFTEFSEVDLLLSGVLLTSPFR